MLRIRTTTSCAWSGPTLASVAPFRIDASGRRTTASKVGGITMASSPSFPSEKLLSSASRRYRRRSAVESTPLCAAHRRPCTRRLLPSFLRLPRLTPWFERAVALTVADLVAMEAPHVSCRGLHHRSRSGKRKARKIPRCNAQRTACVCAVWPESCPDRVHRPCDSCQ